MPTYDYVCDACDHAFEEIQSFSEKPLKKCPKCGKRKLRRLFGAGAAILFKGSGFYETDYRSESYKQSAKADAPQPKSDDGGSSKSTDSTKSTGKADSGSAKSSDSTTKSSKS